MNKKTVAQIIRRIGSALPASIWTSAKKCFYFCLPGRGTASSHYRVIKNPDPLRLKRKYENTWKDSSIPAEQLKVNARTTKDAPVFQTAVRLVRSANPSAPSILEIGCSTGYYADVFAEAGIVASYEGCDYSEAFIAKARELHPTIPFRVEDATRLSYPDTRFDIAISGCCILHIIDYDKAIAEAARVAKSYALFHRTPVLMKKETTYAEKVGYGLPMFEIFFNEQELFGLFRKNSLAVIQEETIGPMSVPGLDEPVLIKSYLCKKL